MREASSYYNMIGFSDRYQMALSLDEINDRKPGDFLKHGLTYKIQTMPDGHLTKQRFERAIEDEMKFIKGNPYIYGSGREGHYNCNTFVANVLFRACDVSGAVAEDGSSSVPAMDAAGPDSV